MKNDLNIMISKVKEEAERYKYTDILIYHSMYESIENAERALKSGIDAIIANCYYDLLGWLK